MTYISTVSVITFCVVYFGGLTTRLKVLIDSISGNISDFNFVVSYMVSFGLLSLIIGGFVESVAELRNTT